MFFKSFFIATLTVMKLQFFENEKPVDKSKHFFSKFYTQFNVPAFDKIKAKHYMPALEKVMADERTEIEALLKNTGLMN